MKFSSLLLKSFRHRMFTTLLIVFSIAVSVALLLGVEKVRVGTRESFANTISQTDLVVGAKGGTIQLLMYSVFRMGSATDNIEFASYEKFKNHAAVEWTIPFSLGDSHMGFRVVGTDENFYRHFRFHGDKSVSFAEGRAPEGILEVALGSAAARELRYKVGDKVVVTHGVTEGRGILEHKDKPFTVTGILAQTGTPVDRSIYVTLQGIEAIHVDWSQGAPPMPGSEVPIDKLRSEELKVGQITSFLLRSKSRIDTLRLQREIGDFQAEPLMAIIPAVVLNELWNSVGYAESALRLVSAFVLVVGLIGMVVSIYNSLEARRREMAILRAVGAGRAQITLLLLGESLMMTFVGVILGVALLYLLLWLLRPYIAREFGLLLPIQGLGGVEWAYLAITLFIGSVLGLIPAIRAYRNTLVDGLAVRF